MSDNKNTVSPLGGLLENKAVQAVIDAAHATANNPKATARQKEEARLTLEHFGQN